MSFYQILKFPQPTGPFAIGTKTVHLKDVKRKELHVAEETHRELLVQVWYPAKKVPFPQKSPYLTDIIHFTQKNSSKKLRPLLFFLKHALPRTTYSLQDAPLRESYDKYPLIIFCHGLGSYCSFYTAQLEELASNGYIVIGINHPYIAYVTHFPDGRTIPLHSKFKLSIKNVIEDGLEDQVKLLEEEVQTLVNDVSFVLDELSDQLKEWASIIDKDRIGIMGHSLGGAVAAEACRKDQRLCAGMSLDGSILEETAVRGFAKPFMFLVGTLLNRIEYPEKKLLELKISKAEWDKITEKYKQRIHRLCTLLGEQGHYRAIPGAGHFSFTDISLASPTLTRYLSWDLGIHSVEVTQAVNTSILTFFNTHLSK
jgi:dienelactone hydrolase